MADLDVDVSDGVAVLTLNRPHRRNAFTLDMTDEWAAVLRRSQSDPSIGAIVLTGAGDAFCSGVDLDVLAGVERTPLAHKEMLSQHVHRVALALEDLDKPVIAAVNGVAVGAGMDMALMCDMRFAGRSATFSEGYVRVGLVPGDGGCYYLPRLVGPARALELLLTGDTVDADAALAMGLVNHVYDDGDLLERTVEFAARVGRNAPLVTALIKRAVRQSAHMDVRTHLDLMSSHMGVVMATEDSQEAMLAFQERRAPRFVGR